jgi:predicted metalloprotease with PDZ domain
MQYLISYNNPHHQYIDIEFRISNIISETLTVQLPAWRPGRYELGNFAKNIQKWQVIDEKGNAIKSEKNSKDSWKIFFEGAKEVIIKYNYYAAELNAGSTFLDQNQLYINPVNCFVYVPDRMEEPCEIKFNIPSDYKIACSLKKKSDHVLLAKDYHELADSPLIASCSLKHHCFTVEGIKFHLWFQGVCKPAWEKLEHDFSLFIKEQLSMMKDFPENEYHFLFQILTDKFYHGVEHSASTVIALGPSHKIFKEDVYNELLGVSSHELFHTWNIKAIRPIEMFPYDYSRENYSRLGYVCEGATTYYGDLLLFRAGVFSEREYFRTFNMQLQKHFDNPGRHNLSVADSSFDTWLDGYVAGIPGRKTSIYTEGCLISFIIDIFTRKNTNNQRSLDDVMRTLYFDFAKKNKGYTDKDYRKIIEEVSGQSFGEIFDNYIYGTKPYDTLLNIALDHIGCELIAIPSVKYHESAYGIKADGQKVIAVYPGSAADEAGIKVLDEIVAINNIQIKSDLAEWSSYFENDTVLLTIFSGGRLKQAEINPSEKSYYKTWSVKKLAHPTLDQAKAFESWSGTSAYSHKV